jgi:hypothetical protein
VLPTSNSWKGDADRGVCEAGVGLPDEGDADRCDQGVHADGLTDILCHMLT